MTVVLDHHIIPVREKNESASFLARMLGLPYAGPKGAFASVHVGETILDFSTREPFPRLALRLQGQRAGNLTRWLRGWRPKGFPTARSMTGRTTGRPMCALAAAACISRSLRAQLGGHHPDLPELAILRAATTGEASPCLG